MEWKDITSYSRSKADRTPSTFEKKCGKIRIVVTNSHVYYPGSWVAHAHPLFDNKLLSAATLEEAKSEVVQIVRDWLSAAAAEISD